MATLDSVLPLERCYRELRIASPAAETTALVNDHRPTAVKYVATKISRRILNDTIRVPSISPLADGGTTIQFKVADYIKISDSATTLQYSGVGVFGEYELSSLTPRTSPALARYETLVNIPAPDSCWRFESVGARFYIDVDVGVADNALDERWASCAVQILRELYDGTTLDAVQNNSAIMRILDDLRVVNVN